MHRTFPKPPARSGFTLIELVVAMTIVAILASVALPAYTGYVARARRADARTQLLQVDQFMQRFYAANDNFAQDRAGNAVFDQVPVNLKQSPADSAKLYDLVIPAGTLSGAAYEIRMVPVSGGSMGNDQCGTFTLTSSGIRGVLVGAGAGATGLRDTCWKRRKRVAGRKAGRLQRRPGKAVSVHVRKCPERHPARPRPSQAAPPSQRSNCGPAIPTRPATRNLRLPASRDTSVRGRRSVRRPASA